MIIDGYVRLIYYIRFYFQTGIAEMLLLLNDYYFHQSVNTVSIQLSLNSVLKMESCVIINQIYLIGDRCIF